MLDKRAIYQANLHREFLMNLKEMACLQTAQEKSRITISQYISGLFFWSLVYTIDEGFFKLSITNCMNQYLLSFLFTSISDSVSSVSWGSSLFLVSEDSRKELLYKHVLVALASQFYLQNLRMYVLDSLLMLDFSLLYWDVHKDVINHV